MAMRPEGAGMSFILADKVYCFIYSWAFLPDGQPGEQGKQSPAGKI